MSSGFWHRNQHLDLHSKAVCKPEEGDVDSERERPMRRKFKIDFFGFRSSTVFCNLREVMGCLFNK